MNQLCGPFHSKFDYIVCWEAPALFNSHVWTKPGGKLADNWENLFWSHQHPLYLQLLPHLKRRERPHKPFGQSQPQWSGTMASVCGCWSSRSPASQSLSRITWWRSYFSTPSWSIPWRWSLRICGWTDQRRVKSTHFKAEKAETHPHCVRRNYHCRLFGACNESAASRGFPWCFCFNTNKYSCSLAASSWQC